MAVQSSKPDPARKLLADLAACQCLNDSLLATAPLTCAAHGGADHLIAKFGRPTGAGFWSLGLVNVGQEGINLWEDTAREHRAGFHAPETDD